MKYHLEAYLRKFKYQKVRARAGLYKFQFEKEECSMHFACDGKAVQAFFCGTFSFEEKYKPFEFEIPIQLIVSADGKPKRVKADIQ